MIYAGMRRLLLYTFTVQSELKSNIKIFYKIMAIATYYYIKEATIVEKSIFCEIHQSCGYRNISTDDIEYVTYFYSKTVRNIIFRQPRKTSLEV